MTDVRGDSSFVLLILSAVIVLSVLIRHGFERTRLPPIVGYTALGLIIGSIDHFGVFLSEKSRQGIEVFAEFGLVALLFRVGLESNITALIQQIRPALLIWISNMTVAGIFAFVSVRYIFDFGPVAAIFAAVALSATSVGVSTAAWRDVGALGRPSGALLLDVAELDDISAAILIGVLFALGPLLQSGESSNLAPLFAHHTVFVLANLVAFAIGCAIFSQFIEKAVTKRFADFDRKHGPAFFAAGAALAIAAAAEFLGLSLAIGAVFAGLAFSRDPQERMIDKSFSPIYDLFAPFFFVHIGMGVEVSVLPEAFGLGLVLFGAAVLGKLVGAGAPAWTHLGARGALIIGVSMIPRAEIALLVAGYGRSLGGWAMPAELYNAIILTSLATCLLSPVVIRWLLMAQQSEPENGR